MAAESSCSVLEIPKELLTLLSTIDDQSVCKPLWTFAKQANGYSLKLFWSSREYPVSPISAHSVPTGKRIRNRQRMDAFLSKKRLQSKSQLQSTPGELGTTELPCVHASCVDSQPDQSDVQAVTTDEKATTSDSTIPCSTHSQHPAPASASCENFHSPVATRTRSRTKQEPEHNDVPSRSRTAQRSEPSELRSAHSCVSMPSASCFEAPF